MTGPCLVSVVIPTYRRRASVQRALEALAQQTLSPSTFEVVVAIDGSDDGTREMVSEFSAPFALRALWQPNRGRASACNAGINAARGELLVLLDDDMEASPGFLAAHVATHPAGSRRGIMGAAPIAVGPASPPVVAYVGAKFNRHLEQLARPGYRRQVRDFYSGNFSIRRDVLLEVGAFDEDFTVYGNEDVELSLRLTAAGVDLAYHAGALAHQHYTKDFEGLARDTIAKGRTAVLLARKHPEVSPALRLSAYREGSRRWRFLRAVLLHLGWAWPGTATWTLRAVALLERFGSRRLDLAYTLVLDYCFWLGARSALRQRQLTDDRLREPFELVGNERSEP